MRRSWITVLFIVACGLLISSQLSVYGQDIPSLDGDGEQAESASDGQDQGDEGGEAAPAPSDNGNGDEGEEPPPAPAGDTEDGGGEDAQEDTEDVSVFSLIINNSGVPGWIIILMSVVAIYLIGQMAFSLRRSELMPEDFILALEDDLEDLDLRDAMERCLRNDCVLARAMEAGLREVRAGYDEMLTAMEEAGEAESIRLHQHVGWLSIIGAIAPMLGLTGTVLGMMAAFGTISQMAQQPEPSVLANDIQLALTTTCEGLIVAVPVLVFYAVFKNRVTALMLDVGIAGEDLLSRFKNIETTPAMVAEVREAQQAITSERREASASGDEMGEDFDEDLPEMPANEEQGPEASAESDDEEDDMPPPPPPQ